MLLGIVAVILSPILLLISSLSDGSKCSFSNSNQMTSPNPRVVIIGGGASGLAAASKLAKAGLKNLTLLEAADRLGGRIHSFNFNGHEIELGAQWVHGQEGKLIIY